jgi:DeoR/GlpR family transcriptional regulator of sugar metabolism
MLAAERRNKILELLYKDKKVVVGELSGLFNVSGETIRRDLDILASDGAVTKGYGGAVLNEGIDLPFKTRKRKNTAEKQRIAALIEPLVPDGGRIILDASTTAVFAAVKLKAKQNLTVLTNSVEILIELADMSGWEVIGSGGQLVSGYLAMTGPVALAAFEAYYADAVIFSSKGFDMVRGITDGKDEFAQIKKAMLKAARLKILAVDSSKFNQISFAKIADASIVDRVVTDTQPEENWLRFFRENGIRCVY